MKPYYEHGGVTIYHGDCREILPALQRAALLLTDPPYGIAQVWKGGSGHGWGRALAQSVVRNAWDDSAPSSETLALAISKADEAIVWGGNYFALPPSRCWLVWNKPERNFSLAEAELAWTNRDAVVRVYDGPRSDVGREHPTQKPLKLFSWCVGTSKSNGSVLDPFMGSGTTLLAAKNHNRSAVGIDRVEEYCEMAAKRLSQEVLFGVR